jgi:hypothetical protein
VGQHPLILEVLAFEEIQRTLEKLAEMLTKIQKALGEYLERQRSAFPRFYFVGDEDLLEIIGNSKDLYLFINYLSCWDKIKQIKKTEGDKQEKRERGKIFLRIVNK